MSHPRMRQVMASGDEASHVRGSITKVSGDSVACTINPNQEAIQLRSRSKNKIPKSVRYDLENALVGLCDVWFEEIKPHLVRNNIKLHVHGSSAVDGPPSPSTPPAPYPAALPAPAPTMPASGCSHVDPGAASDHRRRRSVNYAACYSTPPIVSRAPCIRHSMPCRRPLSPLISVPQTPRDCIQLHNCEENNVERARPSGSHRRAKPQPQPQPQPGWRVPRPCRTHSTLSPLAPGPPPPQHPPSADYYRFIVPHRGSVKKNKKTQTEQVLFCENRECQWETPRSLHSPGDRNQGSRSPNPAPLSPGPQGSDPHRAGSCNPISNVSTVCHPSGSADETPVLSLPRHTIYRLKRPKPAVAEKTLLFKDDLIDIIGEINDNRLRLLDSCPEEHELTSFMNLVPLHIDPQKKLGGLKKNPVWR